MTPGMSSHFKIGLFVILAIAALIATAIGLQIRTRRPTVTFHTYFDESVQGLQAGSTVLYRGVKIGNVGQIAIAQDRRHVDVAMAIDRSSAEHLDLARTAPQLRASLGMMGITGVKYIDIDYAAPGAPAPEVLPFAPVARYIPSQRSFFGGLQHDLDVLGRDLPTLVKNLNTTLGTLDTVLAQARDEQVMKQLAATLAGVNRLVRHLGGQTAPRLDHILDELGGPGGVVASARRAIDSLGDFGREATRSSSELGATIRDLGDAARAVRALAQEIEREPDILVKGRGKR